MRRLHLWLFAIIFLGNKLGIGCRTRLSLVDYFGQIVPFTSHEDVPRAIKIQDGELQEHGDGLRLQLSPRLGSN